MTIQSNTAELHRWEKPAHEPADSSLDAKAKRALIASAYQPILRGFFLPAAFYYAVVVVLDLLTEAPADAMLMAPLAAATSVAAFALYFRMRTPNISVTRMEVYSLAIYLLVFSNILLHHLLHLEVPKLVYFALLTLTIATSGVTIRVVLPTAVLCLATSLLLAAQAGPEVLSQFGFIAFASSFIALGMATLMRRAIRREITTRLKAEQMREVAQQAADFDFLTGLPNRRNFFVRLEEAFADRTVGAHLALGLVDLNGFKHVNDLYGHAFGDQLLVNVGRQIAEACRGNALVARLGGDEFAILIREPASDAALRELGLDICAAAGRTHRIADHELSVTAAVGFARRLATTAAPTLLYEHADYALYRAKESFAGAVEIFSSRDEAELDSIRQVEYHLCGGSFEDEMHVEYQPLVNVLERQVIGFEGLARWESPQLGRVPPDIFIRAAERCGVMHRLTPTLLRKALADASSWPSDLRLAFNLSARDVVSAESIEQICRIVRESGFAGERIDFEITETAIMTDFERIRISLARIRELGAHIALDDFGVGYSNFQHLAELAIDKLKIDRRFVSHIGSRDNPGRIVKTMIEMCANLGLTCVVEGVETEQEVSAVMQAGGSIMQGYYFGRPMVNDRVAAFLDSAFNAPPDVERRSA